MRVTGRTAAVAGDAQPEAGCIVLQRSGIEPDDDGIDADQAGAVVNRHDRLLQFWLIEPGRWWLAIPHFAIGGLPVDPASGRQEGRESDRRGWAVPRKRGGGRHRAARKKRG